MTIYVDAWLDCRKPRILVKDKHNNEILAKFNSRQINKMFNDGDICCEDICSPDLKTQLELVKTLLLFKAKIELREQIKSLSVQHNSGVSFEDNILPFIRRSYGQKFTLKSYE